MVHLITFLPRNCFTSTIETSNLPSSIRFKQVSTSAKCTKVYPKLWPKFLIEVNEAPNNQGWRATFIKPPITMEMSIILGAWISKKETLLMKYRMMKNVDNSCYMNYIPYNGIYQNPITVIIGFHLSWEDILSESSSQLSGRLHLAGKVVAVSANTGLPRHRVDE